MEMFIWIGLGAEQSALVQLDCTTMYVIIHSCVKAKQLRWDRERGGAGSGEGWFEDVSSLVEKEKVRKWKGS